MSWGLIAAHEQRNRLPEHRPNQAPLQLFLHKPAHTDLPPSSPIPCPRPHRYYSPLVSAACCFTAALSLLKALSAAPSKPFAPMPEVSARPLRCCTAARRRVGTAARWKARSPIIVVCVLLWSRSEEGAAGSVVALSWRALRELQDSGRAGGKEGRPAMSREKARHSVAGHLKVEIGRGRSDGSFCSV